MDADESTITTIMQAYAEDAVDFARDRFNVGLDFTESSLESVEQILGTLHDALPRTMLAKLLRRGPSRDEVWQMAKVWGGYLGEVIRHHWGGEWTTETDAYPGTVITLRVRGTDVFPPAKVHKRLTNGPEDNIWFYYQVLANDWRAGST
jgi:hypothetical protein